MYQRRGFGYRKFTGSGFICRGHKNRPIKSWEGLFFFCRHSTALSNFVGLLADPGSGQAGFSGEILKCQKIIFQTLSLVIIPAKSSQLYENEPIFYSTPATCVTINLSHIYLKCRVNQQYLTTFHFIPLWAVDTLVNFLKVPYFNWN